MYEWFTGCLSLLEIVHCNFLPSGKRMIKDKREQDLIGVIEEKKKKIKVCVVGHVHFLR